MRSAADSNPIRLPEPEKRGLTLSALPLVICVYCPELRSHMKIWRAVRAWFFSGDVVSNATRLPFATLWGLLRPPVGRFVIWRRLRGGLLSKRKISLPLLPFAMMSVDDSNAIQRA